MSKKAKFSLFTVVIITAIVGVLAFFTVPKLLASGALLDPNGTSVGGTTDTDLDQCNGGSGPPIICYTDDDPDNCEI